MQVSAKLKNLRKSPRKVRMVSDMLKGLEVKKAQSQLKFLVKGSVPFLEKLLASAVANSENNFGLDKDNLYIKDIVVNEGSKLKRWLPRAHGRASLLLKRTSNVEIILEEIVKGKGRKKVAKQEIKDVKKDELKKEIDKDDLKEEKKEILKEKEFVDEKKKITESKGFLKRVFRRKSI